MLSNDKNIDLNLSENHPEKWYYGREKQFFPEYLNDGKYQIVWLRILHAKTEKKIKQTKRDIKYKNIAMLQIKNSVGVLNEGGISKKRSSLKERSNCWDTFRNFRKKFFRVGSKNEDRRKYFKRGRDIEKRGKGEANNFVKA